MVGWLIQGWRGENIRQYRNASDDEKVLKVGWGRRGVQGG
jgi:hypothetical protein